MKLATRLALGLFAQACCLFSTDAETIGVQQIVDMYALANPYQGGGWETPVDAGTSTATITRESDGIGLTFSTSNLPKGTYTVWMIIYNDPSQCANVGGNPTGQCDAGGDMLNQDISTLIRCGGDIVDGSGVLSLSSWTPKDDALEHLPGSMWGVLTEPFQAEVQLLVLWHGAPLPLGNGTSLDTLEAQMHDIQGGCEYYRVNGGMDPAPIQIELFGGPFEFCPMIQGAVFPATEPPPSSFLTVQKNSMYMLADPFQGGGWLDFVAPEEAYASVSRTGDGVGLFMSTQGLPKGGYTIWMIIYNDPSQCANAGENPTGNCDTGGDMLNQTISVLLRAAGDVVDGSGNLVVSSWIPKDDTAQQLPGSMWGILTEPFMSEVQLLLVWHGDPLALGNGTSLDSLEAQIHNLQGGCQYYRFDGGMDPAPIQIELFGGPFEFCPMTQGAVFRARVEPTPAPQVPTPASTPGSEPTAAPITMPVPTPGPEPTPNGEQPTNPPQPATDGGQPTNPPEPTPDGGQPSIPPEPTTSESTPDKSSFMSTLTSLGFVLISHLLVVM